MSDKTLEASGRTGQKWLMVDQILRALKRLKIGDKLLRAATANCKALRLGAPRKGGSGFSEIGILTFKRSPHVINWLN